MEWKHNKMLVTPSTNVEMRTSHANSWAELHVSGSTVEEYGGSYELLVTSPAGRTVVATWTVEEAGESVKLFVHIYSKLRLLTCIFNYEICSGIYACTLRRRQGKDITCRTAFSFFSLPWVGFEPTTLSAF